MTPEGELFGSGDPDKILDLTMYIESANLSEKHAQIKFFEDQYILKDCNSEDGTWTRINTTGVDLYEQDRSRVYKISDNYQF
jgi:hypothetical protein